VTSQVPPEFSSRFVPGAAFPTPRKVEFEPPAVAITAPLDWKSIFGRDAPVAVEIGCGGGRTLIKMALAGPEWNFLGVERAGEYYRTLRDRVSRRKLPNLRVARTDAAYLIGQFFADSSVSEYHIYFPDPWPKKRHQKRRMFNESFCADLKRTLVPGGIAYVATDYADYHDEILTRLRAVLAVKEHPGPWEDAPEGRTNYEVKYLKEGRPIWRLIARKA
jgi:tRNA (guanine-N7-)-methyltransferase